MKLEDFQSYNNLDEVLDDFAIPHGQQSWGFVDKPSKVSLVELPPDTSIRRGIVKEQKWDNIAPQSGGATQFEILGHSWPDNPIPSEWFSELGDVNTYLTK